MKLKIAVLPGDGIGPEVINESQKILEAIAQRFDHSFEFESASVGAIAIDKFGNPLPEKTLALCKRSDAILFGAIGDPKYDNDPSAKVRPEQGLLALRKELGLFANIRPLTAYDKLTDQSPLKEHIIKGVDITIFRELTGGIYFGEKSLSQNEEVATDLCSYSKYEIERVAKLAFQAAQSRNNKLTLVDKANVLETSRLWRKQIALMAKDYPEVAVDYLFVDNAAMQLILNPKQFDVILTENMFGDILSDEASVIAGSIGLLASASIGNDNALFEPIHGSYPQAKELNIANPIASILSSAMLLDHFNLTEEANMIREAVEIAIQHEATTPDLNQTKPFSTEQVGEFIRQFILEENQINFEYLEIGQSTII